MGGEEAKRREDWTRKKREWVEIFFQAVSLERFLTGGCLGKQSEVALAMPARACVECIISFVFVLS